MHALALTALALLAGDAGFFSRPEIEFWGPRPPKKVEVPPPEPETDLPAPLRELLEDPTPERATAYLAWQKERLARLRKAIELIREAGHDR